jgi:hypothetical protein
MTKEWQEATNEYLKVSRSCIIPHHFSTMFLASRLTCPTNILSFQSEKSNPMYGISSEGYSGVGHVQSKSAKAQGISLEAE